MTESTTLPVRKSVTVAVPPDRAFAAFTAGMIQWWPKAHSINTVPLAGLVIEEHADGRWFERGEDGSECDWGRVLVWDPPHRLVMAWQLDANWRYDPAFVTELHLQFAPDGQGATRVALEHRDIDRYGAQAHTVRTSLDSPEGWDSLLRAFAASAVA